MYIDWLQIQNVRNLTNFQFQPAPSFNLITGPNASGKTSILEAIFLLSRAKSFRTPRLIEAIQHDKPALVVGARLIKKFAVNINTGIERGPGHTTIHFNGEKIKKISDQARNIPLILLAPDVHNLVSGTPKQRRHWLDWAMFHVEPAYLDVWRSYHRALRQRNNLLKSNNAHASLLGWELVMEEAAEKITNHRRQYLKLLKENLGVFGDRVLLFSTRLELYKGWQDKGSLAAHLYKNRDTDRQTGYTKYGIHCSDIKFYASDRPLSSVCSRGQLKVFIVLLLISQAKSIEQMTGESPLYLLDDFNAEMDSSKGRELFDLLNTLGAQIFCTATDPGPYLDANTDMKTFHVEHGKLVKVVE